GTDPGQIVVNMGVLVIAVALGVLVAVHPAAAWSARAFLAIVGLALLFGVLLIIPIGGADMPTVISFLHSSAGLSAVAMGFVLNNKLLVTAGALDGSSGLILSIIMCRAMNRSFTNVLFGAFGTVQKVAISGEQKAWKQETVEGAAQLLEQANLVVVIPGYGMAVAQAQHKVRELYDQLTKRGITVKFAIHPVAVRRRQSGGGRAGQAARRRDRPALAEGFQDPGVITDHPLDRIALHGAASGRRRECRPAARIAEQLPQQLGERPRLFRWREHAGVSQQLGRAAAVPRAHRAPARERLDH